MRTSPSPSVADRLRSELDAVMVADRPRLAGRIARLARRDVPPAEIERVANAVAAARERAQRRAACVPRIAYPPDLPVSERRDEIAAAIREHPVVIVCGETGSGKTTQLPKICLELGRGLLGFIGHTQPRRIAARSVAARIAEELGTPLGAAVGYKVRFTDRTQPDAYIKLMTDGILLAETQGDRLLAAYDTIIVDEAHERSLNIDFLIGYLRQLTAQRPDLKIVVTSATLDAERFARHFGAPGHPAPVIEVSGRMYPVEVRYRPLAQDEDDDEEPLEEAIVGAVEELWREGSGDILAFLPGEREIRETQELLARGLARRPYAAAMEILPLFARLSVEQQQRVFTRSSGRRIVLATNVAETSLTVPGIHYVIDPGLARVRRYSLRNKVGLLQIEKISRASADQRAGRCGRIAAGVCVRLYGEEDFAARPGYTDPEILRSSLAAVILRMAALELGPVDAFPFLDPPSPRAIADGYQLLSELGAVDARNAITPLGRELAKLPVDPRIGRMIIAGKEGGCLAEMLVIASALAVPDPRDRPLEKQQAADQAHLRFRDERSDFLSLIALWQFFGDALATKRSHRELLAQCRAQFVSFLRLNEWRDLHRQLSEQLSELGWRWRDALPEKIDAAGYATIHRALLAGLLSNIGTRAEGEDHYLGARGLRFFLHPGSGIAKKGAKWVLAAELTETTRLYARCAARIEPEWIEAIAGDRVEKTHFDPRWDAERGEVTASERAALYGLTLVARRRVSYAAIDPERAREVFIREALVPGEYATTAPFLAHNGALLAEVAALEHKARRQDVLVGDDALFAFYAERIPTDVATRVAFERWRSEAEAKAPRLLFMTREALMRHAAAEVTEEQYPEFLEVSGLRLPLKYRFAPEHPLDGLTLTAPLGLLNQLDSDRLSWLVPGMIREKVAWYLKALPKALRNRLTPLPETVTAFLETTPPAHASLATALRGFIAARLGKDMPDDAWDERALPAHLRVNVAVVDDSGRELATGRDLPALRARLGEAAQLSFAAAAPQWDRSRIRSWDFGDLPETLAIERDGRRLTGYPALVLRDDGIAMQLLDTRAAADDATRIALIELIGLQLKEAWRVWEKGRPGFVPTALQLKPALAADALLRDTLAAIRARAFLGDDALPRTERAFAELAKRARARLPAVAESAFRLLAAIATEYRALSQRLGALPRSMSRLGAEVGAQRDRLVYPGFMSATPWAQLAHLPRYLKALDRRLAKYPENPARDAKHAAEVAELWERYRARLERDRARGRTDPGLEAYRWLLEELRVSLFAQELRTPFPVSYKRLEKAWKAISAG
ncbi:MAG TPA: ATP-dependent RNA helicase HrpA [Casimicrobiaceae bacterium]|nr:ATP-dependent RNA helicase HrpA [Casimicrobiaceae bacterium]